MLHKGEINYKGQCFILYTQNAKDPLNNFCYQIAKKVYPYNTTLRSKDIWNTAEKIRMYLTDGFDRYKITEIKEKV
jgi:collagenase-like PrtC family protease